MLVGVGRLSPAELGLGAATTGSLIGRSQELVRVLRAWGNVVDGRGRIVFLAGDPGIGKTRLAREVMGRAVEHGATVLVGRSFEQQSAIPFFPFTEALADALAKGSPELRDSAFRRWPELAYLIPDVAPETTGGISTADTQQTQLLVFRAATGFLRALSETAPLVLVLEDLHCADGTSLGLLLYIGRHLATERILLLGTYRDVEVGRQHPLDETLRELDRERLVDEVQLRGLARDDTDTLIRMHLADARVSDELVTLVHERTAGNPLYVEELLKAFVEQGALTDIESRARGKSLADVEVPRSVRSVIGGRVARLHVGAQELLHLASVIGQEFELDVLLAATEEREATVLEHLDAALAARLIVQRREAQYQRFGFVHALIQQTLYAEIPLHQRRRLHRLAGEALEASRTGQSTIATELARHFLAAGDSNRAIRYTVAAAEQAAARYAHAEAANNYQIALDLLSEAGDHAQAAQVEYRLADELYDLNQLQQALAKYESALARFERLADTAGQAFVHGGIGRLCQGRYDMVSALAHLDEALRLWPADREDAELVRVLLSAARARTYAGEWRSKRPLVDRALALAERLGDPALLGQALGELAVAQRVESDPRPRMVFELFDRAEALARPVAAWRVLHGIYLYRAVQEDIGGYLEESLASRQHAVEAAERAGETARVVFALHCVAASQLVMGDWEQGRIAARTALELDPDSLLQAMPGAALLTWMEGQHELAVRHLQTYVAGGRRRSDQQSVAHGLRWLADFLLQLNRVADAEPPAREAAQLMRPETGFDSVMGYAEGPLAEAVVRLGAPDAWAVLIDTEDRVRSSEQYMALPQVLRARGLLLQRNGDMAGAIDAFQQSTDIARAQHARVQLGRTLFVLADVARRYGAEGRATAADQERMAIITQIGPEVCELAWASEPPVSSQRRGSGPMPLTRREQEVAALVAKGLTNRDIAQTLVIAEGTVGAHIDHILNKLGFRSRAQIAVWSSERDLRSGG
jgi:DNA-binding CsgD family transcriptional regulator/tetratricopeptide (TPR) repeat protein